MYEYLTFEKIVPDERPGPMYQLSKMESYLLFVQYAHLTLKPYYLEQSTVYTVVSYNENGGVERKS